LANATTQAEEAPAAIPAAVAPAVSAANPAKDGAKFTNESLGTSLEEMGYDVKRFEYSSGQPYYRIAFSEGTFSGSIDIDLSPNEAFVWLSIYMQEYPKDQKFPPDVLAGLLGGQGTEFFVMKKNGDGTNSLYLRSYLPNHRVTRTLLRSQIKDLGVTVVKTAPLWDKENWVSATEVAKQTVPAVSSGGQK
jgi:hypothetical protein